MTDLPLELICWLAEAMGAELEGPWPVQVEHAVSVALAGCEIREEWAADVISIDEIRKAIWAGQTRGSYGHLTLPSGEWVSIPGHPYQVRQTAGWMRVAWYVGQERGPDGVDIDRIAVVGPLDSITAYNRPGGKGGVIAQHGDAYGLWLLSYDGAEHLIDTNREEAGSQ